MSNMPTGYPTCCKMRICQAKVLHGSPDKTAEVSDGQDCTQLPVADELLALWNGAHNRTFACKLHARFCAFATTAISLVILFSLVSFRKLHKACLLSVQ